VRFAIAPAITVGFASSESTAKIHTADTWDRVPVVPANGRIEG